MKIVIFGGSFNPVHIEHVNIVKAVKRELSPDKIIIVPSYLTPQKAGRLQATAAHRLKMCSVAFSGTGAEISDYEIRKGGVSYSFLTCRHFKELYPDDEVYFLIGADMLENFPYWKNPEEILKCVKLAVCARKDARELLGAEKEFKERFKTDIIKLRYVGADISSTRIRALAALGESVKEYVGENIANYIKENAIYGLNGIERVKQYLKPERWKHTVRVTLISAENCSRFGISEQKAVAAAALHDCAKYMNEDCEELSGFVCPEGVPSSVVHQYAGAYFAEHGFGIKDEEILDAIRFHTSGKENMSPLGKLLFVCDMLEEGRDFDGINELREIFSHSLDEALSACLKQQLEYLENSGKRIYPLTKRAYEYLKENKNGQ